MVKQHRKIDEFKKRVTPISYTTLEISERKAPNYQELLSQRVVAGYGNLWGTRNQHGEKFLKGSWSKSIRELGPESNSAYKLKYRDRHGKSCALFDELREDDIGLYFRTKPFDDVTHANELLTQIRSGTINNNSVGFRHNWDKVDWDEESDSLIIIEGNLLEISGVDIPSDQTTYMMRSEEEMEVLNDEIEYFIESLQKNHRLQARRIFTKCLSLRSEEPLDAKARALLNANKPTKNGIDYNYLIKHLNFSK